MPNLLKFRVKATENKCTIIFCSVNLEKKYVYMKLKLPKKVNKSDFFKKKVWTSLIERNIFRGGI